MATSCLSSQAPLAPQLITFEDESFPSALLFPNPPWPLSELELPISTMETAIRWASASSAEDQRFLSVDFKGQTIKHCKVTERPDKFTLVYDVVSSLSSGSEFRSFEWSLTEETLIAIGHASGEIALANLEDGTRVPLLGPTKAHRVCNGLAWSSRGLLAAGLDKFRGDHCIHVWDPHQPPVRVAPRGGADRQASDPLRKYANGEPAQSVTFLREQPSVLIAGMKGQSIRLYDLREGPGTPSLQFSTRCVHHIAVNWLDENYFASCAPSDNATVTIWDRRAGSSFSAAAGSSSSAADAANMLEIKPDITTGSTIWRLQFSPTHRNHLGMLTDTGIFRDYHVAKEYISEEDRAALEKSAGSSHSKAYPELLYTKHVRDFQTGHPPKAQIEDAAKRVKAFDFMTSTFSGDLEAITMLDDKTIALYRLPQAPPAVSLSCLGFLASANTHGNDFKVFAPATGLKASQALQEVQQHVYGNDALVCGTKEESEKDKGKGKEAETGTDSNQEQEKKESPIPFTNLSSRERREKLLLPEKVPSLQDALTLMTIQRLRLKEGHFLNPEKVKKTIVGDPALEDLWDWIEYSRQGASDKSLIVRGVDLNYLGVQSVWSGNLGLSLENRLASSDLDDDVDVPKLIEELVNQLDLIEFKTGETERLPQRKLCLDICGATGLGEELEKAVFDLVDKRQHGMAAALAIFQDETELAYKALRSNRPSQAHKILAMAIAGWVKGEENVDWAEICRDLAKELTDPFSKAIMALVSNSSWESVLEETTLPLRYRVEVALRWLPDDQLTTYIRDTTAEAIRQGDIEGIVLTGLDHGAMDLFQSYIQKFNDLQTAVSVMSYAVPRFVSDTYNETRFDAWRNTYRKQMMEWKMHFWRAHIDNEYRNVAVTWDGRKLIKPPVQQVSLVCTYCTRPLSQRTPRQEHQPNGAETIHNMQTNPLGSGHMGGIVCPKCGRHMPRCGVCSMWLGSAHPLSRGAIEEDSKKPASTVDEKMKRAVMFCIKCSHGCHADHAKTWFAVHKKCPVTDCNCSCQQ